MTKAREDWSHLNRKQLVEVEYLKRTYAALSRLRRRMRSKAIRQLQESKKEMKLNNRKVERILRAAMWESACDFISHEMEPISCRLKNMKTIQNEKVET